MATISQTMSLEDKVSPNLDRICKNAILLANEYKRLEKEQANVIKVLDAMEKSGQANSKTYENLTDVYHAYDGAIKQLTTGKVDLLSVQEENERIIREEEEANKAAAEALRQKKEEEARAREEERQHREEMIALNQQLELLNKAWRTLTGVMREANQWMQISNIQFNAEFTAASKMHTVLGATSEEIQSLYDYAGALQKVGVVGDEAIIAGMSSLSMYTKNTEQIRQLIPKIVDMAVQENGLNTSMSNVSSTATIVGRALTGQMMMLKRQLGLTDEQAKAIDNLTNEEEKFNAIMNVLNARVGKANETLAITSQGGIKQTTNAFGDLRERLGNQVVPYFELFNKVLVDIMTPLVEFVEANSNWLIPAILGLVGVLGGLIIATTIQTIANSALAKSFVVLAPKIFAVIWPLLVIVGILWLVIKIINSVMGTEFTFLEVTIGIVYLVKAVIQNLFITIQKIIESIEIIFIGLGSLVLQVINGIAKGIDLVFGTHVADATQKLLDDLDATAATLSEDVTTDNFIDWQAEAVKGRELGKQISNSISDGVGLDLDKLTTGLDDLTTLDNAGNLALNTTMDDGLLKDEDLQMLLDIAGRDFKLNYQTLTPSITVTFTGDIRETADVEQITEVIVRDMEDAIYNDLEVATA